MAACENEMSKAILEFEKEYKVWGQAEGWLLEGVNKEALIHLVKEAFLTVNHDWTLERDYPTSSKTKWKESQHY